jgi:SulP family sulfate permease
VRLKRTRNPDVVIVEHLEAFLHDAERRGVTVLLAGVRADLLRMLENVNLTAWFSAEQIFPEEGEPFSATLRAVRYGTQRSGDRAAGAIDEPLVARAGGGDPDPAYYLV